MRYDRREVQRLLPLQKELAPELTPEVQPELVQALAELLLAEARSEAAHRRGGDNGSGEQS